MVKRDYRAAAREEFGLDMAADVPLAPYSTWKIGGPARYFLRVKTADQVVKAVAFANTYDVPAFILGGGSNILVSDAGFDGLVLKIELDTLSVKEEQITADAGVTMGRLAAASMQHNLQGLEWAVGIPGTVGGAVFGNSNCFGGSTGGSLTSAVLLTKQGERKNVDKSYFNFSYDYSRVQDTDEIVLEATFRLQPVDEQQMSVIRSQVAKVAAERSQHQPLGEKCAGSTFKAIVPTSEVIEHLDRILPEWRRGVRDGFVSAGYIIDQGLGLRGYVLDKMRISDIHANFFINRGGATAQNAKVLIDFVKATCKNKLGITLEEEIKYVGNFIN